jgi:uncharacterized alpha-E superfamily protein
MLSRNANSIYWMSRYLERADNVARFIAVNAHLTLDMGLQREAAQWEPLVRASGDDGDFRRRYTSHDEHNVLRFLTFDRDNKNSILSCVKAARENARTLREIIPSETWETINALYHFVERNGRRRRGGDRDLDHFLTQVRTANHLLNGSLDNTMSHGEEWHFARLGKLLERADKTARMLDVKYFSLLPTPDYVDSPYDAVEWGAVLKSVSGFEMYRKKFHGANYRDVADFLILEPYFPRSIRYCVCTASRSLRYIAEMLGIRTPAQDEMAKLRRALDDTNIEVILWRGLHEFVDEFQLNLNALDDALHRAFFGIERRPQIDAADAPPEAPAAQPEIVDRDDFTAAA